MAPKHKRKRTRLEQLHPTQQNGIAQVWLHKLRGSYAQVQGPSSPQEQVLGDPPVQRQQHIQAYASTC